MEKKKKEKKRLVTRATFVFLDLEFSENIGHGLARATSGCNRGAVVEAAAIGAAVGNRGACSR